MSLQAELTNKSRDKEVSLRVTILAPNGKQVYEQTTAVKRITASRTQEARLPEIEIENPQVWDLDTPQLYTAVVTLLRKNGTVADEVTEHFGIRTIEMGPDYGLKLNGKKVLLKGYANHHSLGALLSLCCS